MHACCTISDNLSRIKRESVNKDAFSVIGTMAANLLNSTEDRSLMHRPNFKDHIYKGGNKFPAVVSKTELQKSRKASRKLKELIPMYDYLYDKDMEKYYKNTFDSKAKVNFITNFKVLVMVK